MRADDYDAMVTWFKNNVTALQNVSPVKSSTVTLINPVVNVLTASLVIAPANANRKGFVIFNNSSNSCYVSLAGTSVASTCTRLIATFTSWEFFPQFCYQGAISAIRNAGSGGIAVWEFT